MPTKRDLTIVTGGSVQADLGQLIISAPAVSLGNVVELVVGRVGFPNVEQTLRAGGAVLFETPDDGLLEVRVLRVDFQEDEVEVLVSQVSPGRGIRGGFAESAADNTPFLPPEVARIRDGLDGVRIAVGEREGLSHEQVAFVSRKLDEMQEAAERLGRRDWINLAIGTVTNMIITAALGPDAGRFLLQSVGSALSWLFSGPLRLLS